MKIKNSQFLVLAIIILLALASGKTTRGGENRFDPWAHCYDYPACVTDVCTTQCVAKWPLMSRGWCVQKLETKNDKCCCMP
ncbi:hypothetical protein RND81_12G197100 [Saponaria officinalis]|uniref:Uncharacterized protein n=1 Tax=Saponaria officinalis TaxID=3572 RepID=A0AAW1HCT6_SAPOF